MREKKIREREGKGIVVGESQGKGGVEIVKGRF